jgi:hypothetical protein
MYKKMLLPIFLGLILLTFVAACSNTDLTSHHAIKPLSDMKSAPAHAPSTSRSAPVRTPSTSKLPASTSELVEGYLTSDKQHLLWIQWKESSSRNIEGIWRATYYNVHSKTINDFKAPFTGTLSGESISINIHYSPLMTVSASGTLKGKDLHVTLSKGGKTIDAYGTSQATYEKSLQQLQTGRA